MKSSIIGEELPAGKVVTLLEILRLYAEAYVEAAYTLTMASMRMSSDPRSFEDGTVLGITQGQLEKLLTHCEHLPVTAIKVREILFWLRRTNLMKETISPSTFAHSLGEIQSRLKDELSTMLFFQLPSEKHKMFANPTAGWKEVIERWPDLITDVEEMYKCFALSRYAGSVFHSIQTIEQGLLKLGAFLSVKDPISGWTAVANELKRITSKKFQERDDFESRHFAFIEQMQGVVEALKNAWRNKISHASGRLYLLSSDFTPDTAEEIVIASRSFMRRLATELPKS